MKTDFLLTSLLCLVFCGAVACQSKIDTANQNRSALPKEPSIINLCVNTTPPDDHTSMIDTKKIPRIQEFQVLNSADVWFGTGELSNEVFYLKKAANKWEKLEIKGVKHFSAFNFWGDKNGWAVDFNGDVWKTNDAGNSWNIVYSFKKAIEKGEFLQAKTVKFVSEQIGWLTSTFGDLYYTSDGGQSWKKIENIPETSESLQTFFSADGSWILYRNPGKAIHVSVKENGGWKTSELKNASASATPKSIFFADKNTGYVSTADGNLFNTADGGKSWEKLKINAGDLQINSIFWSDAQTGWIAGGVDEKNPAAMKTTDGGKTWEKVRVGIDETAFNKIYFSDKQNGWLISRDVIYNSQNGGETWSSFVKVDLLCK